MRERTVFVTHRCNLRCAFCDRRRERPPYPSATALAAAVATESRARPEVLVLRGGEPLLVRALPALVRLARDEGAATVELGTNGLLLADARRVRELVDAGLCGVRVMVPAASDADYARLTGLADGFARVRVALANARAVGWSVRVRHPVATETAGQLPGVRAFVAALPPPCPALFLDPPPAEVAAPAARAPEPPVPRPLLVLHEDDEGRTEVARLDVTDRCDERCVMCDLPETRGDAPVETLFAAVADAAAHGVQRLLITGGEPTLHPALSDVVRRARAAAIPEIELQTNAVRLATPGRAAALADAGLTQALVSLHSADPATSDAVTGVPGSHAKTEGGIDALLAAGVAVRLNCVLLRATFAGAEALVELAGAQWARRPGFLGVQFHTVHADPRAPERWRPLVPPLSELAPVLRRVLDRCRARGVPVTGPGASMGVPYCALDGDPRYVGPLDGPAASRPHRAEREWFTRAAACEACRLASVCPGVQTGYAAIHGSDGLRCLR